MREAMLWKPLADNKVHCDLCCQYCVIADGARGKCGVRENRGGTLYTLVDDLVAAANLDPIEKKPLYHFLPGTTSFSIGTMGCNLSCGFCQNWSLSQPPKSGGRVEGQKTTPEDLVRAAKELGAATISYTYSEPTIFFELVQETARLALRNGLRNVLVSNGFMTPRCLDELGPLIQAANIDLKAFTERFYKELCGARLAPVLENLKHIRRLGWHLEVTTLVIPGWNDSDAELTSIAEFIAKELGTETPWHVSRFHPTYHLTDRGPTPVARLEAAYRHGKEAGLAYVYVGNVPGHPSDETACPRCGCVCIERSGFTVRGQRLENGACPQCGQELDGVWK
ncbi:Radical SAM domain protein [Desulfovibrio sp. X2]|uniref:AmmeMemoRadiSam system radical SAM enzyme n=1 Tax=Desulfovibrio sp. X2 TaxID=941449 RepID=UPI0003589D21|nr:AmmeMemoRadiSam system radical SAM enzyme [Desulfovibrio sp. X2]EPR44470.1 Radical SAM domain protein [Desulfovibrio sp. X2]